MIFSCPKEAFPQMVTVSITLYGAYIFCYITVYRNGVRIGEVYSDEGMEGNDGSFEFAVGDKIKLEAHNAQYMEHAPKDSIDATINVINLEGIIRGQADIYCSAL